jgi:thiamine-monophosphate kinase
MVWLITTDCLIEDIHFRFAFTTLAELGAKAVAVNLSDIAAMGGRPRFGLVTVGLPADTPVKNVEEIYQGIRKSCEHYGLSIIGGDTTLSPQVFLSLVIIGEQRGNFILTRKGASVGDLICVSGTLGDSALGLLLLEDGVKPDGAHPDVKWLIHRHLVPLPRVRLGSRLAEAGIASAMIDLSDGLATDLKRLCEASGVGAQIELSRLPRSSPLKEVAPSRGLDSFKLALTGGEDYELLFTVPPGNSQALERERKRPGPRLTTIGTIVPKSEGLTVVEPDGQIRRLTEEGFDHFRPG